MALYKIDKTTGDASLVSGGVNDGTLVKKAGDTMTGRLTIQGGGFDVLDSNVLIRPKNEIGLGVERKNSGTLPNRTVVQIGNDMPFGREFNTYGCLRIYGDDQYCVNLQANPTANRAIDFPNASGTLALTTDVAGRVSKTGDTIKSDNAAVLTLDRNNSGTSSLSAIEYLGNDIPEGTAGCADGAIRMYGKSSYYTTFDAQDSTANRRISAPDKSGTIALTSDVDEKVSKSGDTMSGRLTVTSASGDSYAIVADRTNNSTTSADVRVNIGNSIVDGTTGSTYGVLRIYSKGSYRAELSAQDITNHRSIQLPNASGTLALSGTIPLFNKVSGVTGTTKTDKMTNGELVMVFVKVNNNDYFPIWWSHICGCGAMLNASYDTDGGHSVEVRVKHSNRQYWIEYAKLDGNDVTSASTLEVHRMTI